MNLFFLRGVTAQVKTKVTRINVSHPVFRVWGEQLIDFLWWLFARLRRIH